MQILQVTVSFILGLIYAPESFHLLKDEVLVWHYGVQGVLKQI